MFLESNLCIHSFINFIRNCFITKLISFQNICTNTPCITVIIYLVTLNPNRSNLSENHLHLKCSVHLSDFGVKFKKCYIIKWIQHLFTPIKQPE